MLLVCLLPLSLLSDQLGRLLRLALSGLRLLSDLQLLLHQ